MPYRPERPVSIAAVWARRLGVFALALAVVAFALQRFQMLSPANAVAVILLAAAIALVVAGLSLIGFAMLWLIGAKGGKASVSGLFMALLVLAPVGFGVERYLTLPPIHDISTDTDEAPDWLEQPAIPQSWLPRSSAPDGQTRALQLDAYPVLTGRRYDGAIDRVIEAVNTLAIDRKWTLVAQSGAEYLAPGAEPPANEKGGEEQAQPEGGNVPIPQARPDNSRQVVNVTAPEVLLQYRWRSSILGLDHDILIRLSEEEETTFVDMRAATRVGEHDLGLNARLVSGFLRDLDVALLGIAGN